MMRILGIETSCDETGVAIYERDGGIVAEALASQAAIHAEFGGIVPELASRDHIAKLGPMLRSVLAEAELGFTDLDAIAYTAGPGLVAALMVGSSMAGSLAYALGIPAIPIHHMEAHLLASMLEDEPPEFPFLGLLVSGGHTQLVDVQGLGRYRIVGETLDDAVGEAFDKVARLLLLPYPGGPELAVLAEQGDPESFDFPRPLKTRGLDFSFSGLKTAVRLAIEAIEAHGALRGQDKLRANLAASFQFAVVDTLAAKCQRALAHTGLRRLVVAGGVGANRALRTALAGLGQRLAVQVYYPRPSLCTDNAAMIAYTGWCRRNDAQAKLPAIVARPRWPLDRVLPPAAATRV